MLQSATTLQLKKREIGASKKERREVKMKKKKRGEINRKNSKSMRWEVLGETW